MAISILIIFYGSLPTTSTIFTQVWIEHGTKDSGTQLFEDALDSRHACFLLQSNITGRTGARKFLGFMPLFDPPTHANSVGLKMMIGNRFLLLMMKIVKMIVNMELNLVTPNHRGLKFMAEISRWRKCTHKSGSTKLPAIKIRYVL